MILYIISTIFMAFVGLIIYIYYLYQGQFEGIEDVKYQLFQDETEDD